MLFRSALERKEAIDLLARIAMQFENSSDYAALLPEIISAIGSNIQHATQILRGYQVIVEYINEYGWESVSDVEGFISQQSSYFGHDFRIDSFRPLIERREHIQAQVRAFTELQVSIINDKEIRTEIEGKRRLSVLQARINTILDQAGFTHTMTVYRDWETLAKIGRAHV